MSSRLLPLVPPGADVVAGFKTCSGPWVHGHLLLSTHNNRLDFQDWQALTGADSQRVSDEVIEVATSGGAGNLAEHLLLVEGRFDRERILHSLEENGRQSTDFLGQRMVIIKPFDRERGDMNDDRWLVILENRIGLLGTPGIVRRALQRYTDHSLPDSVLEERLSLLRPDVTSWNVLSHRPGNENTFMFARPHSAFAELQQDTDLLLVGAHFGSKVRIDFSLFARAARSAEFFASKAAFFTGVMASGPNQVPVPPPAESQRRVERFSVGADHVQGSVELSQPKFEAWCQEFSWRPLSPAPLTAHGN